MDEMWLVDATDKLGGTALEIGLRTTVLFGSVPWSKFSHMFFKPAAAYQKNLAHLNGGRNHLPAPADKPAILGKPKKHSHNY